MKHAIKRVYNRLGEQIQVVSDDGNTQCYPAYVRRSPIEAHSDNYHLTRDTLELRVQKASLTKDELDNIDSIIIDDILWCIDAIHPRNAYEWTIILVRQPEDDYAD